jgi:uncharacterized delta-60 repeat protein
VRWKKKGGKMRYIFVLVLILTPIAVDAQNVEWVARYNGPANSDDFVEAITVDGSGYVYITGGSRDTDTTYDIATIKYTSDGDSLWLAIYDGPEGLYDIGRAIAVDVSGNVYITGETQVEPLPMPRYDYVTVKYNSDGTQRWVRTYNGPDSMNDITSDIAVDGSGNVYVTGSSNYLDTDNDYMTVAYDSAGTVLWTRRYWGPDSATGGDDNAQSIAVDNDGNIYVTGFGRISGYGDDYRTIKYDSAGDSVWIAIYNGPVGSSGSDRAYFIAVDESSNVYVAGQSQGTGYDWDYLAIKYNSDGVEQWVRRYNGPGNADDYLNAMVIDNSGNVYITGKSAGSGTYDDFATVKYSTSGDTLWISRYEGPVSSAIDGGAGVAVDDSGNVYVTGFSNGFTNTWDYVTIMYDSNGIEGWVATYNGPDSLADIPSAIAVADFNNIYVTGSSSWTSTDYDYFTIRYSQGSGIEENRKGKIKNHNLEIFPNPLGQKTVIRYNTPYPSKASLNVYDVTGRLIVSLLNKEIEAGTYTLTWDTRDNAGHRVPSGIYFVRFKSGQYSTSKELMIIR